MSAQNDWEMAQMAVENVNNDSITTFSISLTRYGYPLRSRKVSLKSACSRNSIMGVLTLTASEILCNVIEPSLKNIFKFSYEIQPASELIMGHHHETPNMLRGKSVYTQNPRYLKLP